MSQDSLIGSREQKQYEIKIEISSLTQWGIIGSAWSPGREDDFLHIEIIHQGQIIAHCRADGGRPSHVPDDRPARCGFFFLFTKPLGRSTPPVIRVRSASGSELTVQGAWSAIEGLVSDVTVWGATGWAWMPRAAEAHITVQAVVGEQVIGQAVANGDRPDVRASGYGSGRYGFVIAFETAPRPDALILFQAISPDGVQVELSSPPMSEVYGFVDILEPTRALGWAWRPETPEAALVIELVRDEIVIAHTPADRFLPNLWSSGRGSGCYGFVLEFDLPLSGTGYYHIRARHGDGVFELCGTTDLEIQSSDGATPRPRIAVEIEGAVDYVTRESATGWAWQPSAPDAFVTVEAMQDGLVVGRAIADQFREDLAYWGKGTGSCGFTILFERLLSGSAPEIGVKVSGGFVRLEAAPSAYDGLASAVDDTQHRIEAPEGALEQLPTVEGNVDYLTRLGASGWAWLPQESSAAVTVEALLDGKVIGSAVAGELREDLAHWGKGTGRYGFTLTFEAEITGPNAPTFEVTLPQEVAVLPAPPLPALPETNYSVRPSVTGSVDRMTRWEVEGWAWMPDHPTQALEVRAVLDGIVIGRAIANQFRQDLADYGLGNGRYGYNIQFNSPVIGDTAPVIEPCLPLHQTLPGLTSLPSISRDDLATRPRGDIETLLREHESFTVAGPHFEEFDPGILEQARNHLRTNQPPWVIAFYLPQFHAIAENDKFWGQGFTEWRQLPRGISRFPGHYQPRTPRDLGFYNLLELDSLNQQATLAQAAGITAFAYYYYWFNGNRVLEKPLEVLLNSDSDVPFMIIWANENWTRAWDGSESSVLLQQDYRESDDEALVADLARHFTDRRYLRIQTRPLFVIYNPVNIPDASKIIEKWRHLLRSRHMLDPLIFMAQTFGARDPREFGLDGAIEFPPHKLSDNLPGRKTPDAYSPSFTGRVIDYEDFVLASISEPQLEFPLIKTAVPSWDNESRRPNRGLCLEGISPTKFENWLRTLCIKAIKAPVHGQPIVAINAWNEWAEGAYLEPDVYYGAAFLNATARAVTSAVRLISNAPSQGGVSVILPNFNHEQFIAERIHSVLNQSVRPAEIIFLDDCSSDGSVARAREILETADIPFRIVLNEENSGCVFRQWVKGMALAQHDLIWVAETDDSVHQDFLLHILPCFEQEEVRAAYGHIEYISPNGEPLPYLEGYYDDLKDFDWRKSMVLAAYRAFSRDFAIKNVIPNASGLVFRKPLLTQAEQERLFEYRFAGDWYFYALVLRGGALAYSRPARSYFRMNASSASRSAFFTDRHLAEHAMIIADLSHLMGVSRTVVVEHAASLAKFIEGRSPEQLEEELVSAAGLDTEPRPMRICIGAHSFEIGGGEVMPLELANELRRAGHHVTYLVVEPPRHEARQIRHRLRSDIPVVYWDNIKSDFEGFIKDYGIEIINSHNISLDYRLATQKYVIPIPYVSSLHGGIETVTSIMTAEIYTYLAHNVSTWLFLSEKNVTALRENGIPAGKFKRSFNALPNYDGAWVDRLAFRAEHGISADSFVLVQCSRAIEAKGWDIAAEVTALVAEETGRDVRLVLFGDGPMAAKFRNAPPAETDHLVLMGQVNLPIRYFQCFDAAIFPSTFSGETFPLFMLEAFAAGLPVISTDIGEIGHIMGEAGANSPGVVVSHKLERYIIVREMARELSQLVQNYDVLQKMQDNARATSNRFSIAHLGNLYIDEFRCLQRDRLVRARDGLREPE